MPTPFRATLALLSLLPTISPGPAQARGIPPGGAFPDYRQETRWEQVADYDEAIQKEFLRLLEAGGYAGRIVRIPLPTPPGNAVPSVGGTALPLSGLVVTHSMDGDAGRGNDVKAYLAEGYDCLGVDKAGRLFVRGNSFLRTDEPNVPNRSAINLTFDLNAERGERVTAAQVKTAADVAEALQRAFDRFGTKVRVVFKDHHEPGLKPGKKYLEAGPARDAANERLRSLR